MLIIIYFALVAKAVSSQSYGGHPGHQYACDVLNGTNQHRAQRNRAPLTGDSRLDAASMDQCNKMASLHKLEHETYGTGPGERVEMMGYDWNGVAENIYDENGYGNPDPHRAVDGWIKSPGHEKNMVGDYTQMGSAFCYGSDGTVYWAQNFGKGDPDPQYMYICAGNTPSLPIAAPAPPPAPVVPTPPMPPVVPVVPAPVAPQALAAPIPVAPPVSLPPRYAPQRAPLVPIVNVVGANGIRYGPNGRPCLATGYGLKSVLVKRAVFNKSPRRTSKK